MEVPHFQVIWIDWIFRAASTYPKELVSSIVKKLIQNGNEGSLSEAEMGSLAEYHVRSGIDDYSLVDFLKSVGLEVILHERYFDARYKFFRLFLALTFSRWVGFGIKF
jgi:hypothetical protein